VYHKNIHVKEKCSKQQQGSTTPLLSQLPPAPRQSINKHLKSLCWWTSWGSQHINTACVWRVSQRKNC